MKQDDFLDAVSEIDSDIVEQFLKMDNRLAQKNAHKAVVNRQAGEGAGNRPRAFRALLPVAAVLLVLSVLTVSLLLPMNKETPPPPPVDGTEGEESETTSGEETTTGGEIDTEEILEIGKDVFLDSFPMTASSLSFVYGNSVDPESFLPNEPPAFEFRSTGVVVKARYMQTLPDVYCQFTENTVKKPITYKVVQFETLEVWSGVEIPRTFLYLIRESLWVDFSQYDFLVISMGQIVGKDYVLINQTQNCVESFPLYMFDELYGTELGEMIAFNNGVFDESLWQSPNWRYGYQFAKGMLDRESTYLVVQRGYTEADTRREIEQEIQEWKEWRGDEYTPPGLVKFELKTQAAVDAMEYTKPFANGVFSRQRIGGSELFFRRYINGCMTDETVTIHTDTGEVVYSENRYSKEELDQVFDLSQYVKSLSEQYAKEMPAPSHFDPSGKSLVGLNVFGWYAKVDGKICGFVKTVWLYREQGDNLFLYYYDDAYLLVDENGAKSVTRDEVLALTDGRNVYHGTYGEAIEMPIC